MSTIIGSKVLSNIIEFVIFTSLIYMITKTWRYPHISIFIMLFLCVHIHQYVFCWRGNSRLYHSIVALLQCTLAIISMREKIYDVSVIIMIGAILHIISVTYHGKSMLTVICFQEKVERKVNERTFS